MGVFDEMLTADESLFQNAIALDFDFIPKLVPYREGEQHHMASCVKPLFSGRSGRNLLIHGPPGVGKTVATRHVLRELEEKTDDIHTLYINCWQRTSPFKVALGICEQLGYRLTHNKSTDDLLSVIIEILNKGSVVLVFDEVDKLEDPDFLYVLLERLYRKCAIMITNYQEWIAGLDDRLRSRLALDVMAFKPYNAEETRGIIKQRAQYAFPEGVLDPAVFERVVQETVKQGDLRVGLHLLREAGSAAEERASRRIEVEDVEKARERLHEYTPKSEDDLDEAARTILELVNANADKRIGDLFTLYQDGGGELGYKSFQRKVKKLEQGGYVSVRKTQGGAEGNTTFISPSGTTTLDQFSQ